MNTKTFIAIITVACATLYACSVNDNNISPTVQNLTPKEQWGPTCKGADFTVPQLPDLYVNYWEYSYSVDENANLALKISGQFPSCRYFSFSTYNDENGDVISGISDFEIIPDEGSVKSALHIPYPSVVALTVFSSFLLASRSENVTRFPCVATCLQPSSAW